jgi:histidinol-phosphate/aromatic aminotransferase/cobyric acid decarboxylase-like protein/adenosyl cobinamide kinase/adenosyl cobinamide phosphate guanylyltransferase
MLALVLGGVRSGKSAVAERLVRQRGEPVVYVATGCESDGEMAARIERHRQRRPPAWRTVETADPEAVLRGLDEESVLVDALGPWLARLMEEQGLFGNAGSPGAPAPDGGERILGRVAALAAAAATRAGLTVVVAEEVGMGLVPVGPDGPATRRFLDLCGEAAQVLASSAADVRLVVAGRSLELPACRPPWRGNAQDPGPLSTPESAGDGVSRLHGDRMVPPGALDFAVSVVPGLPPAWLTAAIEGSLAGIGRYPDDTAAARAVADRHGRAPGEVLPLGGSAEAFWLLASALRPSRAVCVHPSFTEGEAALRAAGHTVERVFRDPETFALDPAAVPPGADLVLVCNPNNPTGTLDPRRTIEQLARPGRVLVVDEAFMDLCDSGDESVSASPLPGVVVLRSLTKVWSVPGLRAGYLLGPPGIVAALRAHRQPWAVSAPALAAIEACALRAGATCAVAARIARWRDALVAGLSALPGLRVWPAAANFVLAEVADGPGVWAGLVERGIAVRRADTFPGLRPGHLRVAVRGPEDRDRLLRVLRTLVAKDGPDVPDIPNFGDVWAAEAVPAAEAIS